MVAEFDTKFNHYRVEDEIYNGRPARVLYCGERFVAQSGIPRDKHIEPLFDYNQRFRELVQGAKPKRLLVIGGGVFTLPSIVIQEDKAVRVDVVEIDGELLDAAKAYFGFRPSNRLTVYIGDGSQYVDETDQQYDMVIIDVFVNAVIPATFQTPAFMRSLRKCCSGRGIVAVNVIGSLQGRNASTVHTMCTLLQRIFPKVEVFPAARDFSLWMSQNYLVVGYRGHWEPSSYLLRSPIDPSLLKV